MGCRKGVKERAWFQEFSPCGNEAICETSGRIESDLEIY
jgi:hypothetical protein